MRTWIPPSESMQASWAWEQTYIILVLGRQGLAGPWHCLTICIKTKSSNWKGMALEVVLWSLHACTHTCVWSICAHTNTHNLNTKGIFTLTYFPFRRNWTWFQPALTLYTQQVPGFRSLHMDKKERNGICSQIIWDLGKGSRAMMYLFKENALK